MYLPAIWLIPDQQKETDISFSTVHWVKRYGNFAWSCEFGELHREGLAIDGATQSKGLVIL